jgi:uncharacterized protein (TIRG00374 family)
MMTDTVESRGRNNVASPGNGESARLWGWHTFLSIGATIAVFAILVSYVDLAQVWRTVAASDKGILLFAALSHYAAYPVRGMRWRRCLRHVPGRCGSGRFGLLAFFFLFVDNVVPAKLGDIYAAHLARINCGVRRSAALGSIVLQRAVDAWLVLFLAAAASGVLFSGEMPRAVVWALVIACLFAVAATAVIIVFIVLKRAVPSWVPHAFQQRISAFQTGMLPARAEIVPVLLLSAVIWALESLWIFLLLQAFGLHPGAAEAAFVMTIPVIATVFPFTPSGAGAVELTLFGCLRLVGIASPLAVSLTVVNRFIDFWLHILLGSLVWVFRRAIGLRTWRDVPDSGDLPIDAAPVEKEMAS